MNDHSYRWLQPWHGMVTDLKSKKKSPTLTNGIGDFIGIVKKRSDCGTFLGDNPDAAMSSQNADNRRRIGRGRSDWQVLIGLNLFGPKKLDFFGLGCCGGSLRLLAFTCHFGSLLNRCLVERFIGY